MSASSTKPSNPRYWARLKPYNPTRGCKLQRCFFLGRVWTGGDGIWDIPEWVEVNAAQAAHLRPLRQSGFMNPQSSTDVGAFDIVTPEQKAVIDQRETELRMRARGIGAASVTSLPNFNPAEDRPNATPARRLTMADLEDAPPPAESAAPAQDPLLSYGSDEGEDATATHVGAPEGMHNIPDIKPHEVDISGRTAAAEGFEQSGMDLNDGADVDDVAPAVDDADYASTTSEGTTLQVPEPLPPKVKSTTRGGRGRGRRGRAK